MKVDRERQAELCQRAYEGDVQARKLLIEENLGLVGYLCNKYFPNSNVEYVDLHSIGTIGLIKGIDNYNPNKGANLVTYASMCIINEVRMSFRKSNKHVGVLSLDHTYVMEDDSNIPFIDMMGYDAKIEETIEDEDDLRCIKEILHTLPDRQRLIISLRYGLDGNKPHTQRETASIVGVTQSYASRLEKQALSHIRKKLRVPI